MRNFYSPQHVVAKAIAAGALIEHGGSWSLKDGLAYDKINILFKAGGLHKEQRGVYRIDEYRVGEVSKYSLDQWAVLDSQFMNILINDATVYFRVSALSEMAERTKQATHLWVNEAIEAGIVKKHEGGYKLTELCDQMIESARSFFSE